MKKLLTILILLALASTTYAALTYGPDNYLKNRRTALSGASTDPIWLFMDEVQDRFDGTTAHDFVYLTPTTAPATAAKGQVYFDLAASNLKYYTTSWQTVAASTSSTLDEAYDAGNAIDVDGSAVTLTTSDTDDNVVLIIAQNEATNNNDAVTIATAGTGDAIQISPGAVSGGGINVIAKASGITPLVILDGSTNNIDLADNKGQILIQCDDPYIHAGATGLMILDSSTPITAAEGFLARFVHSGTARTNSSAVEIEVPATQPALAMNGILAVTGQNAAGAAIVQITNTAASGDADGVTIASTGSGDALQISPGETDSVALNIVGKASSTVTNVLIDGDTGDWIGGADNVAMVEIVGGSTANAHTGGGLFAIHYAAQPKAASEGFLARFVSTGTARTDAYAVEIEVPATQPALAVNGITTFTSQDAVGAALVQVVGVGASGDADAMTISNTGAGDSLQISPGEADTGGLNIVAIASGTVPLAIFDGATNNWDGADNKGQITLTQDDAMIHAGASQIVCHQTGTVIAAAEGFCARFIQDTGAAVTNAYAVEIETTATTPCLKTNGQVSIAGQGATDGVLLDIVSADTDDDTVQLTGAGTGDVLQITCNATTAVGINVIGKAAQTVSAVKIDAATNNVNLANDIGLLHVSNDTALADAGASLVYVSNVTGAPVAAAEGFLMRLNDTGGATVSTYCMEIESTNNEALHVDSGKVVIDETLVCGIGVNCTPFDATADDADGAGNSIPAGTSVVEISAVTNGANDWVALPVGVLGERITIIATVACELRTLDTTNDEINEVDADGTQEYQLTAGDIVDLICVEAGARWTAVSHTILGAAKTIVPD